MINLKIIKCLLYINYNFLILYFYLKWYKGYDIYWFNVLEGFIIRKIVEIEL